MLSLDEIRKRDYEVRKNRYLTAFMITIAVCYIFIYFVLDIGRVSGSSMYPSLYDRDIQVSIRVYSGVKKGDIINIDSVNTQNSIVKRVIGTEGDRIQIVDGIVYVNEEKLQEDYINKDEAVRKENLTLTVPKGYVFVMGDNRNNSVDSRKIGCISLAEVRSKMLFSMH